MTIFLSLIIIVFCILQIILFFKIWGMTNNVNAIKKSISEPPKLNKRNKLIFSFTGEKDRIFKPLITRLVDDYLELCNTIARATDSDEKIYDYDTRQSYSKDEYYTLKFSAIIDAYSKKLADYGITIPEEVKNLKYQPYYYN